MCEKEIIIHKPNYTNNNTEYLLSAYYAAHTLQSLVLYKYSVIFYPKNKIGTNRVIILQNEEIEAQRFMYLLVHTPLINTKAPIPTLNPVLVPSPLCSTDVLFHLGLSKNILGIKQLGWDSFEGWQTQVPRRCLVPLYIFCIKDDDAVQRRQIQYGPLLVWSCLSLTSHTNSEDAFALNY